MGHGCISNDLLCSTEHCRYINSATRNGQGWTIQMQRGCFFFHLPPWRLLCACFNVLSRGRWSVMSCHGGNEGTMMTFSLAARNEHCEHDASTPASFSSRSSNLPAHFFSLPFHPHQFVPPCLPDSSSAQPGRCIRCATDACDDSVDTANKRPSTSAVTLPRRPRVPQAATMAFSTRELAPPASQAPTFT